MYIVRVAQAAYVYADKPNEASAHQRKPHEPNPLRRSDRIATIPSTDA